MKLLPVLLSLVPSLLQLVPGEREAAQAMARRVAIRAALTGLMVVLLLVAAGFGLAAAYMQLSLMYGAPTGAALVALGLLVLALFCAGAMAVVQRQRPTTRPPGAATLDATVAAAMAPVAELRRTVESKPVQSVLIAAAAGMLVSLLRRR